MFNIYLLFYYSPKKTTQWVPVAVQSLKSASNGLLQQDTSALHIFKVRFFHESDGRMDG